MRFNLTRFLHLIHRWLGIVIGVLVLAWFFSGVVMMYVPYPRLTDAEKRAGLTPIDAGQVRVSAQTAWVAVQTLAGKGIDGVRLLNLDTAESKRPAYAILSGGKWQAVWADTGDLRNEVPASDVIAAAEAWSSAHVLDTEIIDRDQWTFGPLDAYRPLHRVVMGDAQGSILYISARTGEVVRDSDRSERAWNWVGSVIHWIYFTPLRVLREAWRQSVMWTSGIAFALALTGTVLGIQRLRVRQRYRGGRVSPYQGWKRWHHLLGLGAAIFTMTWLFSGWLSVNPFGMFERGTSFKEDKLHFAGGALVERDLGADMAALLRACPKAIGEVEWLRFAGQPYAWLRGSTADDDCLLSADGTRVSAFSEAQLIEAAKGLRPDAKLLGATWLDAGDLYYYRHHDEKTLPVLRVDFGDSAASSFYIDAKTGRLVGYANTDSRLYRWLFHALHRLDFPWLMQHRPVWDGLVILLSVAGLALALSGMVLGWQRLKRKSG